MPLIDSYGTDLMPLPLWGSWLRTPMWQIRTTAKCAGTGVTELPVHRTHAYSPYAEFAEIY